MLWKVVVVGKACQKERKKKRGTGAVNIPAIKTCLLSFQNSNLLFEKRKCVAPAINHRRGNPKGGWCAHHTHTHKRAVLARYIYMRGERVRLSVEQSRQSGELHTTTTDDTAMEIDDDTQLRGQRRRYNSCYY